MSRRQRTRARGRRPGVHFPLHGQTLLAEPWETICPICAKVVCSWLLERFRHRGAVENHLRQFHLSIGPRRRSQIADLMAWNPTSVGALPSDLLETVTVRGDE